MDFSELSIVIPSYNRPNFLMRQFNYWSDTNVHLIFLDGSNSSIGRSERNLIAKKKNATYIQMRGSVGERLQLARDVISTPYTLSCNDDDLYFKSGVFKAIELLNKQPDLVACRGQNIRAHISNDKSDIKYSQMFNRYEKFNVTQNLATERIKYAFSDYNGASLFAVLRTWVWKKSWVEGYNMNFSSTNVSEFFQNISVYIQGKLISLDMPYLLETNENTVVNTTSDNRDLLFSKWILSESYQSEREVFVHTLALEMSKKENISLWDSKNVIIGSLVTYLKLHENHTLTNYLFKNKFFKKLSDFGVRVLKQRLMLNLYLILRNSIINNLIQVKSLKLEDFLGENLKKVKFFDHESLLEIKQIHSLILDCYTSKIDDTNK
jgi:glycosyltransferase domain-containing protein